MTNETMPAATVRDFLASRRWSRDVIDEAIAMYRDTADRLAAHGETELATIYRRMTTMAETVRDERLDQHAFFARFIEGQEGEMPIDTDAAWVDHDQEARWRHEDSVPDVCDECQRATEECGCSDELRQALEKDATHDRMEAEKAYIAERNPPLWRQMRGRHKQRIAALREAA